ncbi:MAG: LCP family protein [Anaerofustis sp.]
MKEKDPSKKAGLADKKVYIKKRKKKRKPSSVQKHPSEVASKIKMPNEMSSGQISEREFRPNAANAAAEESVKRAIEPDLPAKKKKRKKKKLTKRQKIKRWMIAVCSVLIAGILIAGNLTTILLWTGLGDLNNFGGDLSGNKKYQKLAIKSTLYDNLNANITFGDTNVINILFFGLDENTERESEYSTFRPDTIMLVSINLETENIQIVSIPRDTYVSIYGRSGKDKINSCFYYGSLEADSEDEYFDKGLECLEGTVSQLLGGVPINYYVEVDMEGVPQIIDTLGGVTVTLDENVYHNGTLAFAKGTQTLNGDQFITLARLRDYTGGDIDRVAMQQKLMKQLFSQVTSSENIMKLPKLISQTYDILSTDLSFKQITTLAYTLKDFDVSNISTDTMPGTYGNLYSISYWIVTQSERVSFIKEHFGITVKQLTQDPTYIPSATPTTTDDTTTTTDGTTTTNNTAPTDGTTTTDGSGTGTSN